jgi:hypothetical protein
VKVNLRPYLKNKLKPQERLRGASGVNVLSSVPNTARKKILKTLRNTIVADGSHFLSEIRGHL